MQADVRMCLRIIYLSLFQNRSKLPLEILAPDAIATKSIESISFSMPKILINVKYDFRNKQIKTNSQKAKILSNELT